MNLISVLTFAGGLSLFLYGMNTMGAGLKRLSGGKMQTLIGKLCSNTFKGLLLGAVFTALIQSSTAVTVIVIGLVNSGIITLYQATGIIMGANLGTTVTSWLLSTTGISSDNIVLALLKPSGLAPVLAVIGLVFFLRKKDRAGNVGGILLGFSVLLFGMEGMSDAVKPLTDNQAFINILTVFKNPLLGLIAGLLLTAIIQSSSASIGILQALSVTGAFTYSTAIPIVLGQNIGTCATTLISGIGADTNAKRAAVIHLYFNIIGSTVVIALFYGLNYFFDFGFVNNVVDAADIAVIHTVFNLVSLLILLPFAKQLTRLAEITVKDKSVAKNDNTSARNETNNQKALSENATVTEPYRYDLLDVRFFTSPSFALEISKYSFDRMNALAAINVRLATGLIDKFNQNDFYTVTENEKIIDSYEDDLSTYVVKLGSYSYGEHENAEVNKLLQAIGNTERIGDYALALAESAERINILREKSKHEFTPDALSEMSVILGAINKCVNITGKSLSEGDKDDAKKVIPLEELVNELTNEARKRNEYRLDNSICTHDLGIIFKDILNFCDRIAAHCSRIAVSIIRISEEEYDLHKYHRAIKEEIRNGNNSAYYEFKSEFALPTMN
ncbi:MAG: Na/Pi cotransporter family protein [Clostridia bacterium]|nr:Na/Pi cotransporter family protein [Clostridia bacterium]MDY3785181.1 Na/Pi cotransporter family protein [Eubacteriales bacterium]